MINKVNQSVKDLYIPGIRVFSGKVKEFADGIDLTIGEPDFATPENVKLAGIESINNNLTGYSHNAGSIELREAVANFFQDKYDFYYNPDTEIIATNGASQGIDSILRTILKAGDEVILPVPTYPGYEPNIHLAGAKSVYLDTTQTNFIPTADNLAAVITDQTKAIILNYPSNPTGVTMNQKQMDEIVSVLKEHDIFIISDEIYSENTFNSKHISFASYKELRDRLFLVHGLSKSYAMTGWRVGFVLGPEVLMEQVFKVHLHNLICISSPSQYAAIEALTNEQTAPDKMNESYMERRDYVYDRLIDMGFSMKKPTGAFYIFPSIKFTKLTSFEFATKLLETEHVAVVPGSAFSSHGEGFIRISYANSLENLEESMNRIENFIKQNC